MARSSEQMWREIFEDFQKKHDEVYQIIKQGVTFDENGNTNEAIHKYEEGLILIDKALAINLSCPEVPDLLEKVTAMTQKLKNTRKDVLCRVADAQTQCNPTATAQSQPPSYEEATASAIHAEASPHLQLQTYSELGDALRELQVESVPQSAEILYEHENVRLYFIPPDGGVISASAPETLKITRLEDGGRDNRPAAFLQVGDWIYPLVPGVSPCYRTEYGAFILPDVHSAVEGAAVGILLPLGADASVHELLDDILQGIFGPPSASPRAGRKRRSEGFSFSISQNLVKGAQYISKGLVTGAEKASGYVNNNTPRLIQMINPEATPAYINPNVSRGIRVAKDVTGTAVTVTGYVAGKVGCATMALGRYLAPHIQRQGTRLLSSTTNLSEHEAAQKMGGVLQVAAGAVEGFGTVYAGLENSAAILASSLANNTVKVVEHKYGQPAARVTGDTLYAVGNVITAGNNVKYFTPKGLAKITAKSTGKAVIEDYRARLTVLGSLKNAAASLWTSLISNAVKFHYSRPKNSLSTLNLMSKNKNAASTYGSFSNAHLIEVQWLAELASYHKQVLITVVIFQAASSRPNYHHADWNKFRAVK